MCVRVDLLFKSAAHRLYDSYLPFPTRGRWLTAVSSSCPRWGAANTKIEFPPNENLELSTVFTFNPFTAMMSLENDQ